MATMLYQSSLFKFIRSYKLYMKTGKAQFKLGGCAEYLSLPCLHTYRQVTFHVMSHILLYLSLVFIKKSRVCLKNGFVTIPIKFRAAFMLAQDTNTTRAVIRQHSSPGKVFVQSLNVILTKFHEDWIKTTCMPSRQYTCFF